MSCSGHGDCNAATHVCGCYPGWQGKGCNIPDCPGYPVDCHDRGTCDSTRDPPICIDCHQGWMGPACDVACVNGDQVPANSGQCVCHNCSTGLSCNIECSGHGSCTDGECVCDVSWRGSLCELPGCPGTSDCSNHGSCNSATHTCICNPGVYAI